MSNILEKLRQVEAENERIRAALAVSKSPCVYCSLPAEEWAKCAQGFPGCARSDDAMGCPELGAAMALRESEARVKVLEEARPRDEWTEEDGPVLWWRFPVDEPPYVGSPLDIGRTYAVEMNISDQTVAGVVTLRSWPGYHTHWTPIITPARAALASKEEGGR